MAARDVGCFKGGPRDGDCERLEQTLVRMRFPGVEGSYVFFGVDPEYRHLRYYRWEPDA